MSDLTDELEAAHAQLATARAYAAGAGPLTAQALADMHAAYPHLGAAALPLVRAGVTPDSSIAATAAAAKVKRDRQTVRHGEKRTGGWLSRTFGTVADAAVGAAADLIPGGQAVNALRNGDAGQQLSAAAAPVTHPLQAAAAPVLGPVAAAGNAVGSPLAAALKGVGKPVVRYGTAGLAAPYQLAQFGIAGTAADLGIGDNDGSTGDSWGDALRSTTIGAGIAEAHDKGKLGQALKDVFTPGTADEEFAGSGWFISPDSKTGRRQAAQLAAANTIDGHAFTPGRALAAATPFEPGTRGYNIVSGLTDLAATLALDPLTYAGGAVAKAQRARNVLDRGDATVVELATKTRKHGDITPVMRAGGATSAITPLRRGGALLRPDGAPLQPDDVITVWHTTSADNARALEAGGFRRGGKPAGKRSVVESEDVAAMLGKKVGDELDYEPGRGMGDGLYVTLTKPEGTQYGDTAVPVRVRFGDLAAPPERPRLNATKSLLVGDGYIPADIAAHHIGDSAPERVFQAETSGLVDGVRKTVLPEVAAQWLTGSAGSKVAQHLADETDFERMRRATGKKLPVPVLVKLVDATDSVQVKNILADAIAQGAVREKLAFKPERIPRPRLAGMMPGDKIDLEDIDDAVEQLDRFQRNVRMDPADISANNLALARAHSNGERYQVVESVMSTIEKGLVSAGVAKTDAGMVTRMFREARDDMRRYFVDEIGDNAAIPGVQIGADGRPLPSPHLLDELIDRNIPLPNARELKRATREYAAVKAIEDSLPYKGTRATADFLTSTVFKPFALALRPAWTVRVVGEEQVRMAAAGKDSLFRHPLSYIAYIAGENDGKLAQMIGRGGQDALGQRWADEAALPDSVTEWAQSLNRGSAGWRDRARILTRHYGVFAKKDPEYAEGWHGELIQLASDPIAREVLRKGPVVAKNKFWRGNLSGVREELHAGGVGGDLLTREGADAYVDSVIERIHVKTGGHSDLIDAVRTGKMRGEVLTDGFNGNPKVRKMLADLAEQGHGPAKVKGRLSVQVKENGDALGDAARYYDQSVEWLFHRLGSVPTNKLSRSPMFRQSYWQRVEETLPLLTKSERLRAVRAAKDAGMSKQMVARMRATVDRQTVGGSLRLDDADKVAKQYALNETRDLLYSLHEKSQAADALRVLFPFGEAWREVLTRWARLGVDPRTMNPLVPYRATQGITGAQDAGIFYTDPTTGQEMFAIPGSEWLTDKLVGVPMKLEAPVSGLNMFGQIIPGVGPVVAMVASKIVPDAPSWDGVRNMLLPFGDPDYTGGVVESMLPAWLKKMRASFGLGGAQEQRTLASMSVDVAAYLYSTGDYDLSKPADQERLLDDAKNRATRLYQIRALAQSTAPASPRGSFKVLDKDGRLHALFQMKEDYRKMLDRDPAKATSAFIDKYGEYAFLVTISKTKDKGANPVTDSADLLARSHPDQAKRFPNVIGLFADDSDTYSFSEYERQIEAGTREVQSLKDVVELGNIRVANAIMSQAREKSSDPTYLRAVADGLKKAYPGWTGQPADLGRTESLVQELSRAAADPVLKKTDAGKGLNQYLALRQQALDAARAGGLAGFQESNAAEPLRAWLYDAGQGISKANPGFAAMFERVFSRELSDQGDS